MKSIFVLVALLACVVAEVVEFSPCDESSNDICEISEIRINPCTALKPCKLKKGRDASISFDFTPKFAATKMKTGLFWASPGGDYPFPDLTEADGCILTNCPLENGKKQELNYKLQLSKKFPSGAFTLKWKLYNEENKEQLCCFKTDIALRR